MIDPADPSDWDGGTYDGHSLLDLSAAGPAPDWLNDDWPRARPFQEDGHLAADDHWRIHPDAD